MCFSATASFTSAAVLIPAGIYCLKEAKQTDNRYWAFAMLPLIFGVQQSFEGGVWLALAHNKEIVTRYFALGFLLFSHLFWLTWVAFSSYLTETSIIFKRCFLLLSILGLIFGMFMYVPLLLNPDWLSVSVVKNSIHYELIFFSDEYVSQHLIGVIYASLILGPLMLSSDRHHSILGVMILVSGIISLAFFDRVFISTWCYFAAIISLYILFISTRGHQPVPTT